MVPFCWVTWQDQKHVLRAFFTQLAQALGTDLDWPAGWPKSAKGHAIPFASPLLKEVAENQMYVCVCFRPSKVASTSSLNIFMSRFG